MPDKTVMLSVKKVDGEEKPEKKKKVKLKDDSETRSQYGLYSGIVGDKGAQDNPKESEAIKNMVQYMKNNNPPQADNPSNVYRPKFSHITMAYKKKNQTTA
mgnify:CR=1 FL=1